MPANDGGFDPTGKFYLVDLTGGTVQDGPADTADSLSSAQASLAQAGSEAAIVQVISALEPPPVNP